MANVYKMPPMNIPYKKDGLKKEQQDITRWDSKPATDPHIQARQDYLELSDEEKLQNGIWDAK